MKRRVTISGLLCCLLVVCILHQPVSLTAATTNDLIDKLLKSSDIDSQISLLPGFFREILIKRVSENKKMPEPKDLEKVERILKNAIQISDIRKMYYDVIKADMSEAQIKEVIAWHDSPLGRRIIQNSIPILNPGELKKREEFESDIMNLQASPRRLALIKRNMKSTEIVKCLIKLEYELATFKMEMQSKLTSTPLRPLLDTMKIEFEQNREQLEKKTAQKSFVDILFSFRNHSDDDLEGYADFFDTPAGKAFNSATRNVELQVTLGFIKHMEESMLGNSSEQGETWRFDEYNFSYTAPHAGWVKMDSETVNPNAKLCLIMSNPQVIFMIIPEIIGMDNGLSLEKLVEFSKGNMKSLASECRISEGGDYSLNGIRGFWWDADATLGNQTLAYRFWNIMKNGVAYQLYAMAPAQNKDQMVAVSEHVFKGFQILDSEKEFYSKDYQPFESFSSPIFNYTLSLTGQGWAKWTDLAKYNPEAEIGGEKNGGLFIVVPAYIGKENVAPEAILSAFLNTLDIASSDKNITNLKEIKDSSAKGYTLNYHRVIDKIPKDFAIRIIIDHDMAYMIAAWTNETKTDINSLASKLYQSFTIHDKRAAGLDPSAMTESCKKAQASFDAYLGSFYYKAKDYEKALSWYRKATALDTESETYLTSSLVCYSALGEFKQGLDYLEQHDASHPGNLTILSWKAWLLKKLDMNDKSLAVYRSLFEKGYRNDSDFIEYADLLGSMQRWNDVDSAFATYVRKDSSIGVHLKQAGLLHDQGKYKDAVNFLQNLQKGIPFQSDISFALARNFNVMEQYKDVIAVADDLITRKLYLTDAYYLKGEAEFNLRWYHKAKDSFELALKESPENAHVKNYIQHISGIIGQGDNSSIKKPITPVPIPDEIAEKQTPLPAQENYADYGAYYISFIKGIHFEKDAGQRITTYRKIKLLDKSGVSAFSTFEIEFDPLSENLYVNRLEVKDETGKIVSSGDSSDYFILDKRTTDMATHDKILNIPIPNLKPGYTIELTSTQQNNSHEFIYHSDSLTGSRPIQYSVIFVTGDTKLISHSTFNTPGTVPIKNGMAWIMTQPPVYSWEPFQIKADECFPMVKLAGSGKTWRSIGDEYLHDIASKMILDETTKKLAMSLTVQKKSKADKIRALVSHIQSEYTYKAIEFGKRAIIPNTSQATIEKKYGDCKDHAVLLHQMLKAVSIPSSLALVNTGETVVEDLPALGQFNHMINYIPDAGGGYYIDTTSKHLDMLRHIPMGLADHKALILGEGNSHLNTIPRYSKESQWIDVEMNARVSENQDLSIEEKVAFKGYAAAMMRDYLSSVDKVSYTNWLQKLYSDKIPKSASLALTVENADSITKDLVFKISYDVKDPCEQNGHRMSFVLPDVWMSYHLEVQPVPERKTDFRISYPMEVSKRVQLRLPQGYALESADPSDGMKHGAFGGWQTRNSKNASTTTFNFSGSWTDGRFEKTAYQSFKNFSDQAIHAASPKIVIINKH